MRLRWYCPKCGEKNERRVDSPGDLFIFDVEDPDSLRLGDRCWSCSTVVDIEATASLTYRQVTS